MNSYTVLEGETTDGEDVVGDEEGVADVIEGGDAEDDVTDGTDGQKSAEVKNGAAEGEVASDVVDGGDGDDDDGPDGGDEESEVEGHAEGVERGMIVEMSPRLRAEELDGAVEDGRRGYQQTKGRRIERGNIIEVHNLCAPPHQTAYAVGRHNHHTEGEEYEQMDIGEEVDELTDGIVGGYLRQKFTFMDPAEGELVTGDLYPDGVDGVGGDGHDVGHNDTLALKK